MNDMVKEKILAELAIEEKALNAVPETKTVAKDKKELIGFFQVDAGIKIDEKFSVKLIDKNCQETLLYIDPNKLSDVIIHLDEEYKVQCEEGERNLYIQKVLPKKPKTSTEKKKSIKKAENIREIRRFSNPNDPLPLMLMSDNDIFIELDIKGTATKIEEEDNATRFLLNTAEKVFECTIINALPLENVPLKLKEDASYSFRGYLAGDGCFYVTSSHKEYAIDQEYTNIPKELLSEFRQLTLRQKDEILNLYAFYKNPDEKVELLPQGNFITLHEYHIKYNLLRRFIPKSISSIIERTMANQENKNRHKLDILKTLLDTVYPLTKKFCSFLNRIKNFFCIQKPCP